MKILFIQSSPYHDGQPVKKHRLYFVGLAPAILSAILSDHEFELCLETTEEIDFNTDAELILISGMGHAIIRSIDIAKRFRALGKTVIMGGYMASLMPEEAKKHCDSVVIGDAELSIVTLVHDYEAGELQPFYKAPLDKLTYPVPDYALLASKKIGDFLPVQAGRGCPNTCSFCSVYCLYRQRYIKRDIDEVIRDIRAVKSLGYKRFLLLDDNIFADRDYLLALCTEIKKLKMGWLSQCSIDVADDAELLSLISGSGCTALSFGLESISQESLDAMNKPWARPDLYSRRIKALVSAGIDVSTEMVVGADGDTFESIKDTARFITENKIVIPRFYILTPIPGTDFHAEMSAEDRIENHDIYSYNGAQAVHVPKNMTASELTAAYWALYRDVFSIHSIFMRTVLRREFLCRPVKHLFYLYINLYYRGHIRKGIPPNII